jgi:hypothetical protein
MVGQQLHSHRVLERLPSRSSKCRRILDPDADFCSGRCVCVDCYPSLVALMLLFFNAARLSFQASRLA